MEQVYPQSAPQPEREKEIEGQEAPWNLNFREAAIFSISVQGIYVEICSDGCSDEQGRGSAMWGWGPRPLPGPSAQKEDPMPPTRDQLI